MPIPESKADAGVGAFQQTFSFWEEPAAVAKTPTKRTPRWANATVATLRKADSAAAPAPQDNSPAPGTSPLSSPPQTGDRRVLLANLRSRVAAISTSPAMETADIFSTGSATLDTWLPGGGLKRGQICEWVAGREAGGAGTLAMITVAAAIADQTGPVIVVDPNETFHAAGAIACGISPDRIVWCRCHNRRDSVWALDQALRCSSVAAVWSMLPWHLDDRDARRLQLAAEVGRTPGLFVLAASEASRPSFAPVRFHVDPVLASSVNASADSPVHSSAVAIGSRPPVDVRTVRVRMGGKRQAVLAITPDARLLTVDSQTRHTETRHEAVAVSLAARLADPTSTRRHARARKTG
ncbi:ImuA family protein [Neorhodopirellula pilleata]|uniref:ImuA family protein n=1 Tax=Neorhodopirellula pilleata TaxID=2714738 RepID=UPI001E2B99B0|nr:cell division inhibitor SulA [Neorhodopirellula pilleata]